eukprot:Skav219817  [mRNA]  locus=scaffold147:394352:395723:+ [translate_table: standard]
MGQVAGPEILEISEPPALVDQGSGRRRGVYSAAASRTAGTSSLRRLLHRAWRSWGLSCKKKQVRCEPSGSTDQLASNPAAVPRSCDNGPQECSRRGQWKQKRAEESRSLAEVSLLSSLLQDDAHANPVAAVDIELAALLGTQSRCPSCCTQHSAAGLMGLMS